MAQPVLTAGARRPLLSGMRPADFALLALSAVMVPAGSLERARQLDDVKLIDAALARDRAAALALTERVGPYIRARVLRASRGRRLAGHGVDDLIHEIWCRLLADDGHKLRMYDPERGKTLGGFVSMIAGQVIGDLLQKDRAQKRRPPGGFASMEDAPHASGGARPDEATADKDELGAVWRHLDETLPARGRLVMKLLFVDGLSTEQIADRIGLSANAVYGWRFKIKKAALEFRKNSARPSAPAR